MMMAKGTHHGNSGGRNKYEPNAVNTPVEAGQGKESEKHLSLLRACSTWLGSRMSRSSDSFPEYL